MILDILLSSQNPILHLTTATHSHSHNLEFVITNNLSPSQSQFLASYSPATLYFYNAPPQVSLPQYFKTLAL